MMTYWVIGLDINMKEIDIWVNLVANVLTIIASGIAIYVFFKSKTKIASILNVIVDYLNTIVNYSIKLTLSELKYKVERLNDYTTLDKDQLTEVIRILNEIQGQINGSKILTSALAKQLTKISDFTTNPGSLTEPKKRSLVAELREKIRHIDVADYPNLIK